MREMDSNTGVSELSSVKFGSSMCTLTFTRGRTCIVYIYLFQDKSYVMLTRNIRHVSYVFYYTTPVAGFYCNTRVAGI
mgnify:FL=1